MQKIEIERILEICQEIDLLISRDPGRADLEILERYRLSMNDCLYAQKWSEAEDVAYMIMQYHSWAINSENNTN